MSLSAGKLWGLRRLADRTGRFAMLAADQRPPIKTLIAARRGLEEAPWDDVAAFKAMLVDELQAGASALLLDPHFAYPAAVDRLEPAKGLILTLEDSVFEERDGGRLSREIDDWSVGKIKRTGADAVKVLAWYRPDADAAVCRAQQVFVRRIGEACARHDIPFVFELLVYPLARDAEQTRDYVEMRGKEPQLVIDSVATFAAPEYGVDLFKLESPLAAAEVPGRDAPGSDAAQRWFDALGEAAGRPWVMLSAGAGMADFRRILTHAYAAGACGYLAGRAIWREAFQAFPDWEAIRAGLAGAASEYMADLNRLTAGAAQPWQRHPCYGPQGARLAPADASFRHHYPELGA